MPGSAIPIGGGPSARIDGRKRDTPRKTTVCGPGSYTTEPCPICGQPSVLFSEYGYKTSALRAYDELRKRPGFQMVNARPHDLPKKSKIIWHIIEREVPNED